MESNRIDEIFKKKLERHSLPVSESAWSQVQSQLPTKKKKKTIIWMVAASISILIALTVGILYNLEDQNSNMAVEDIEIKSSQALINEKIIPLKPQLKAEENSVDKSINNLIRPATKPQQNVQIYAVNEPVKGVTVEEEISKVQPLQRINSLETAVAVSNDIVKLNIDAAPQKEEEKTFGIKVEMYYNQELAEVKTENSTNIFNKKANQLKSLASEYTLADLRSAKNELFASAFQNNRKELNN
jgi:hypothetical protein